MVDATWRVQSNSGTQTASATFTPTLPNPTMDGSTLLLMVATIGTGSLSPDNQSFDPPWLADVASTGKAYLWRRDNQPAGETSWALTGALSGTWAWYIEEWSGLSTVGQPDAWSTISGSPGFGNFSGAQVNDLSTAMTPPAPDVADFAGLAVARVSPGSAAFPAGRSWSSPWSEAVAVMAGTGSGSSDTFLLVAEAYPGVSGSLDVTLTFDITGGGTYADKTVVLAAACYQPAAPPQPADVLTA